MRRIAAQLGRTPSTISREVERNCGRGKYRAADADERAWRSACRPKLCRLAINRSLQTVVAEKLSDHWSPQQISGWLKVACSDNQSMRVSHETIYKSLFVQARGVLKKELVARLRTRRLMRRGKRSTTRGQPRGQIVGAVSIRQRPAEIEDRAIPGHWEGDLLAGAKNSHIATLVERQSRFVMLVQVPGKDTASVVEALVRQVKDLPTGLMNSLTWTGAPNSRTTSDSPWQPTWTSTSATLKARGSAAAMRIPTACSDSTSRKASTYPATGRNDLNAVALQLNTRPRKTLGFMTPAAKLAATVASTG